jgi:preprotein translocase subunit SecY
MDTLNTFLRNPEFLRRLGVTLAVLAVYRVGCWIPLPGVNAAAIVDRFLREFGTVADAMDRLSIMSLGLNPMLSALIIAELAMIAWPRLRTWAARKDNASNLDGWLLFGALAFAALQAQGIAVALEDVAALVPNPGLAFRAGVVVTLVAATACLVWLASLITRHGLGSGIWVLIAAPHVISFTQSLAVQASHGGPEGQITIGLSVGFLALATALFVLLTRADAPLSDTSEVLWGPILGIAVATWTPALLWLVQWQLLPEGQALSVDQMLAPLVLLPMLLIGIALVVILRRRSLAATGVRPDMASSVASATPVIAVLVGLVAAGDLLHLLPAQSLFPNTSSLLILAAVGLALVNANAGAAAPADPNPGPPAPTS